jgi:hypothetical protein
MLVKQCAFETDLLMSLKRVHFILNFIDSSDLIYML